MHTHILFFNESVITIFFNKPTRMSILKFETKTIGIYEIHKQNSKYPTTCLDIR